MINKYRFELDSVGKIEKFSVFAKILDSIDLKSDQNFFHLFSLFIQHLKEYLSYDKKPASEIKAHITDCFCSLFAFIRATGDIEKFKEFLPVFDSFSYLTLDNLEKAKIFKCLGYLAWMANDLEASISYLTQSLDIANNIDSSSMPGRYTNLGYIYEFKGDYQTAEKYYLEGINFAQKYHCREAMFMAYNALGRLNYNLNLYDKAQKYFQTALGLRDENQIDSSHLPTIMNLASTHVFLNQYDQAIDCLKIVQQDWVKNENPELYYTSFTNMAVYYINLEKYKEADLANSKAFKYAQKYNDQDVLFSYYYNNSNILIAQNKFQLAIDSAQKALDIAQKINNPRQQSLASNQLANSFMNNRNYQEALKYLAKSEKIIRKQKNDPELLLILYSKAECNSAIHKFKPACSNLWEYIKLKEKIKKNSDKEKQILKKQKTLKTTSTSHLIFKTGYSLISKELSQHIGIPIIGQSTQIQDVIQQAFLIAGNNDASVLLRGESGTGKELIAKLIHFASNRKKAPFIPINSASVTNGLAQSTLFGHEKGAFTGAVKQHAGLFEKADNGTVFLDEIADMPSDIQAYLLRIIEDKKIRRLGSSEYVNSNFRLISATNGDIESMVKNGSFRLDLLNRINTFEITIPPLRERIDDIPLLIDYYLNDISSRLNRKPPVIEAAVIDILLDYHYPGNVREFINIMEKLIIFAKNDYITENDVCFLKFDRNIAENKDEINNFNLKDNEEKLINLAMIKCNNCQTKAAKLLGIPNYTLSRKLKKISSQSNNLN